MAKPVKPAEYRQMSKEQLELSLKDQIKTLFQLRFRSETERMETPSEITKAKREIARIKTLLRERELQHARSESAASPKS